MSDPTGQARITPAGPAPKADAGRAALCVSGGGSRALSAALGAFSGLANLPDPANPGQSMLDRFDYLSSVSGGSWASVIYTYAPESISDDQLLIEPVLPAGLCKADANDSSAGNVSYLDPHCIGTAPQRFEIGPIAETLLTMEEFGLIGDSKKWRWFWIIAIGELILKPFDLYEATYKRDKAFPEPQQTFSSSIDEINQQILPNNPELSVGDFYVMRSGRAPLFVNMNLIENTDIAKATQIPVQVSGDEGGALGQSPDGSLVGGGSVQPFGFTSTLVGPGAAPDLAAIDLLRRYALSDIAGCSSAFFAAFLLQYVDVELKAIRDEVDRLVDHGPFGHLIDREVDKIFADLRKLLNADLRDVIPTYDYWPIGAVDEPDPATTERGFSDGGDFDNTGILGALARTDASRIVALVNSESPISRESPKAEVMVAGQLALLFGYQALPVAGGWKSYGGLSPSEPLSYVQVFSDADDDFCKLRQGLYAASCGGTDAPGVKTAVFRQTLTTITNPVAHIKAGRSVDVVWLYNNRVDAWQAELTDKALIADLAAGQTAQQVDGSPIADASGLGPLKNFPWYSTGEQIKLDAEGVNMLAQLSAWNIAQIEPILADLLA